MVIAFTYICEVLNGASKSLQIERECPGRSPNKERKRKRYLHISIKCISTRDVSTMKETSKFAFLMSSSMFYGIQEEIIGHGIFVHCKSTTGKLEIYPKMRMICAICIIWYGMSYNIQDELYQILSAASVEELDTYLVAVIEQFGSEFLGHLTEADLRSRILSVNASRWFPGSICSWDWQQLAREKEPMEWPGQFLRARGKSPLSSSTVLNGKRWLWIAFLVFPKVWTY